MSPGLRVVKASIVIGFEVVGVVSVEDEAMMALVITVVIESVIFSRLNEPVSFFNLGVLYVGRACL